MKRSAMLFAMLALCSSMVFAQEGATVFKSKCAICHGPNGEGKIGPKLQGTSVPESNIVSMLTQGNAAKKSPHNKPLAGLTADQAKAVAAYVKSLK